MQIPEDNRDERRKGARGVVPPDPGGEPAAAGYRVRIVYTEPEFQRRTPGAPAAYSFTYFGIAARSPEEAIQEALRDFQETAWRSRVGWRRCVESVTILDGPGVVPRRALKDPSAES